MRNSNILDVLSHTGSILKIPFNIIVLFVSLGFFAGLFSFFYGLFTVPFPGGDLGFYRMTAPTSFEIFYMAFSVVVSALIVTITVHAVKMKVDKGIRGKSASAAGLATGIFGAVCPACLGINFLAFGNVFTAQLSFLIPYIVWIQIGGITLLSIGLYLVARSAHEKKCLSCSIEDSGAQEQTGAAPQAFLGGGKNFAMLYIALAAAFVFTYQIATVLGQSAPDAPSGNTLVTAEGDKVQIDDIIETVTPQAGFETPVRWGGVVKNMVEAGVLDPQKLESILANRYGQEMKPQWRAILAGEDANLTINSENAVFMMYLLWTLAKHNENQILSDSPFAEYFTNYDIGVGRAGYNDTPLLNLTPDQQTIAKSVSENAYRPCCNNSTAAPDCSHGYAALGLVQLMASQGFASEEIFDTFVQFNSFWFPETYIKDALYFKVVEGKDWKDVSKERVAGKDFSTLSGSYIVQNYLQENFGI